MKPGLYRWCFRAWCVWCAGWEATVVKADIGLDQWNHRTWWHVAGVLYQLAWLAWTIDTKKEVEAQ